MSRIKWLQETRMMRFEEAYHGWTERRLTQQEAARLPGVHERSFRRHINRTFTGIAAREGASSISMASTGAARPGGAPAPAG